MFKDFKKEFDNLSVEEINTICKRHLKIEDDPTAEEDITELCHKRGHELLELKKNGNDLEFIIKKI